MRLLVLAVLLLAGTAAAAEEKQAEAVPSREPPAVSGTSTPGDAATALRTIRNGPKTAQPDAETRRRLVMLLMMRNTAQAFPFALLRTGE
jgi:hypothetical protein